MLETAETELQWILYKMLSLLGNPFSHKIPKSIEYNLIEGYLQYQLASWLG